MSHDEIFEKCLQALNPLKATVKESNKENDSIVAKMPVSWESFGETLDVNLSNA